MNTTISKQKKLRVVQHAIALPTTIFEYDTTAIISGVPHSTDKVVDADMLHSIVARELLNGVVHFAYLEKDEYVQVYGTLRPDLTPNSISDCGSEALRLLKEIYDVRISHGLDLIGDFSERITELVDKAAIYTKSIEPKTNMGVVEFYDVNNKVWKSFKTDAILAVML